MRRFAFALCLAAVSCVHAPSSISGEKLEKLKSFGGYVSGEIAELSEPTLLDNKDFSYSIAWGRDSEHVAYSHLAAHYYQVGVWQLSPKPAQLTNFNVNGYEWDVESLDVSPDGRTVVTASRDGVVRFFDAKDGTPRGAFPTEEPLVSVAFRPNGHFVVCGSARGLLTVIRFPELSFVSEIRAHDAEVRALQFTDDGRLYSGGWDKSIVPFDVIDGQAAVNDVRVRFEKRGEFATVRAALAWKASAAFALDVRSPMIVVNSAVAKIGGFDLPFIHDTATLPTPMGNQLVKVLKNQTLTVKDLAIQGVDVAVCDACVPPEVQGVLGKPFFDLLEVAFDGSTQEAVLKRKTPTAEVMPTLTLKPGKRLQFPWYVNDFSLDRAGKRIGVAFSEVPAQRTREIYEREKKKIVEPAADGNAAAIVDAESGAILKKWTHHNGVVSTVGISPDGTRVISGGWDKELYVFQEGELTPKVRRSFGWSVRRIRFSPDGRYVAVAAWTPQNPLGDQTSDPSAVVYQVLYKNPEVFIYPRTGGENVPRSP